MSWADGPTHRRQLFYRKDTARRAVVHVGQLQDVHKLVRSKPLGLAVEQARQSAGEERNFRQSILTEMVTQSLETPQTPEPRQKAPA